MFHAQGAAAAAPNLPLRLKKRRRNGTEGLVVTPALKKAIWDLYIGIGIQEAFCPLCGTNRLNQRTNSGFEAAHIIANKWFYTGAADGNNTNRFEVTTASAVYYLFPTCSSCNNLCRDFSIFDYMYCQNQLKSLRKLIMAVFTAFVTEHEHELRAEDRMAWLVLDRLYGGGPSGRWKAGGGIQNSKQIYEIARVEQYHQLVQQTASLSAKLQEAATAMERLMTSEIKPYTF
jgi:hypothetical protein